MSMFKLAKITQAVLGVIPFVWMLLYAIFVITYGRVNDEITGGAALLMLLAAMHATWIWMIITLILFIVKRKFVYHKISLTLFITGFTVLFISFVFDPGGYMTILLD